mmetsp:Transcript_80953/g.229282  ORF Transcript_80953/g.229282 Transcript_80953/m.229282 type:complete len:206 (+) Transcript_80953:642-1259(+)
MQVTLELVYAVDLLLQLAVLVRKLLDLVNLVLHLPDLLRFPHVLVQLRLLREPLVVLVPQDAHRVDLAGGPDLRVEGHLAKALVQRAHLAQHGHKAVTAFTTWKAALVLVLAGASEWPDITRRWQVYDAVLVRQRLVLGPQVYDLLCHADHRSIGVGPFVLKVPVKHSLLEQNTAQHQMYCLIPVIEQADQHIYAHGRVLCRGAS